MTTPQLPLTSLITRLRAAGFAMDAGREMQLRRVIDERGAAYIGRFDELKFELAPYVATNAMEQRRFYRLWDDYVLELKARTAEKTIEKEAESSSLWRRVQRWLVYAVLAFTIGLVGYFSWRTYQEATKPESSRIDVSAKRDAQVRAGQPLPVFNRTLLERAKDSVGFRWEISEAETGEVLYRRDSFEQDYLVPTDFTGQKLQVVLLKDGLKKASGKRADTLILSVFCDDPPLLQKENMDNDPAVLGDKRTFSMNAEQDIEYFWVIESDTFAGPQVQYEFLTEGQTRIQVLGRRKGAGEYCYTVLSPETIQVGTNLPEIPIIRLKRDIPRQLLTVSGWLYWLPLLFGMYLYWLHRRRWKKQDEDKREKTDEELAEEYPFYDVGPYVIPYQDQSGQITVPADFYRIADQLRVREEGVRMTFDGRATVEATIKEGGFPAWRERAIKRPANYLVLLRHTDEFQQQDRLLKRLTDFLAAREAALDVYYHGGDFGWFWNEAHLKGWSAAQLRSRYGDHRLIILGDGHGLVDTLHRGEPRLLPAKERWLHGWARRLLLTTEPVTDWSYQEVLLHEHLLAFPATTDGILRGVADLNQVEEYQSGSYPRWKAERLRRDPEPSYRYRTWDSVADHREYLTDDSDLFRWLTALAVAPHPDWSLTIAIGRALGLEVTHDRLLRLSRIPWLATNAPDQDLRLEFLALLDPADEKLARAAVLEQLKLVSNEVTGTFAETEWTASQAVQAFALAPTDARNQGKIKELQRVGLLAPDQLEELDLVASREFPTTKAGYQPTPDDSPAYLNKLLNPPAKAEVRFSRKDKELLGMIFACLLLILPMYLYDKAHNELAVGDTPFWWQNVVNPTDSDHLALEANNLAVRRADTLAAAADYGEYNKRLGQFGVRIINALDSAKLYRPDYPLVDSNLTNHYLDDVAYRLNWMFEGSFLPNADLLRATEIQLAGLRSRVDSLYETGGDYMLQVHHMDGLYRWYRYREGTDSTAEKNGVADQQLVLARRALALIDSLNLAYFDELSATMPIHLRYLLAKEPLPLVDFGGQVYTGRTVTDEFGAKPVANVTISLKGTEQKVSSSASGSFRISPQKSEGTLLISYNDEVIEEISLLEADGSPRLESNLGEIYIGFRSVQFSAEVRGLITDKEFGKPISNMRVLLTGTNQATVTDLNGRFTLNRSAEAESIEVIYEGQAIDLFELPNREGHIDMGTLQVSLPRPQGPPEQETGGEDNAFLLERIIDRFGDNRYSRTLQRTGTAAESAAFANELAKTLNAQRGVLRPQVKGDDLIKGVTQVTDGKSHDQKGTFLFLRPRPTPGTIGDKVDQLHRGSQALVVIGTDFAKNDTPQDNLSTVGSATEKFADALEADGFNVTRLRNPTKYELEQSISSFVNADYSPTSQLLIYLSGYHDGEQLYLKDSFAGLMSGFITDDNLSGFLQKLDAKVPHLLVIKNYTQGGALPEGTGDDEGFWPDMVPVRGGTFEMGDTFGDSKEGSREKPVHTVTVSPFEMGRYEVTFAEYDRFTEATGKAEAEADFGRGQQPVINVSWFDAISFANWLSVDAGYSPVYSLTSRKKQRQWESQGYGLELERYEAVEIDWMADGYRLPTEAEWEFAASYVDGTRKARFGNGRDTLRAAKVNFRASADFKKPYSQAGEYRERTVAVGSLNSSNSLGVHDLAGNVFEWCSDWNGEGYYKEGNANQNPYGPSNGSFRIIRGGSWNSFPIDCRAALRGNSYPSYRSNSFGFRLARSSR